MVFDGNNRIDDREAPFCDEGELDRNIDIRGRVQINDWLFGLQNQTTSKFDGVAIPNVIRSDTPVVLQYHHTKLCHDGTGMLSECLTNISNEFVHLRVSRDFSILNLAR
jgi:hypothetical protein